ncbi:hypothetical protein DRJ16_05825, partial [Candidatus Woesearchaeota archaeon]
IIEELTGDCPGVGLPNGFIVHRNYYRVLRDVQKRHKITRYFLSNPNKIKQLPEWTVIKDIINLYKSYWKKNRWKLRLAKEYIKENLRFDDFLERLKKITGHKWRTKSLDVFLTLGYKNSGTYDRRNNVIRIGIHENKKKYLIYTLYHELIHYHIVKHMKKKLSESDEEILCRAIFSAIFKDDPIAQSHWKEGMHKNEIKKIEKKRLSLCSN